MEEVIFNIFDPNFKKQVKNHVLNDNYIINSKLTVSDLIELLNLYKSFNCIKEAFLVLHEFDTFLEVNYLGINLSSQNKKSLFMKLNGIFNL